MPFFDTVVNTDSVARCELRYFRLQLLLLEFLDNFEIHSVLLPFHAGRSCPPALLTKIPTEQVSCQRTLLKTAPEMSLLSEPSALSASGLFRPSQIFNNIN